MVAFLDVGQGDCIFIRTPSGHAWLVDGGSTDVKAVGQYRIMPFLAYYGEYRVDHVCVTHGDEDHLSGIRELLEADRVGHLILTTAEKTDEACAVLAELAKEWAIPVSYVKAGDGWTDGGWQFNCLYPDDTVDSDTDKNDQSMVLRMQAAGVDFLLTGDLSENGEQRLNAAQLAGTEVLKVGHHGSGSSSSQPFLENTGARLAIISCGKNNRYGHPAGETLERLRAAGMDIRLTTEEGAILMLYQKAHFIIQGWKSKR